MVEFKTADELIAHYKALRGRLYTPPKPVMAIPARVVAKKPELPPEPAPEPPKSLIPDCPATRVKADALRELVKKEKINLPVARPKAGEDELMVLPRIRLDELTMLVGDHVSLTPPTIWSNRRRRELVEARFLIWALAREFCHQHSLPSIGRFCNRDHTTVLHGSEMGRGLPDYPILAQQVREILDRRREEILASARRDQPQSEERAEALVSGPV